MKKFTSILESQENSKYYKVKAEIDLIIKADSEGEASYIADSTLSSTKNQSGYNIKEVEETIKDDLVFESD